MKNSLSKLDVQIYEMIRQNVFDFQSRAMQYLNKFECKILDIAPEVHEGVSRFNSPSIEVETLDLNPEYNPTYIADICATNNSIKENSFDAIFCTEVLEHVNNPFAAITEINRILSPGGYAFFSSPFNFRLHNPLPDNWRISEHGWRVLLEDFEIIEIRPLEDSERFLMPFHYTVISRSRK